MNPNNLIIRRATAQDVPTLIRLITALAEYESLAPPDELAAERLTRDGFGDGPKFEAWLAEWDCQPVGYAFLFNAYSTFLAAPTLYLEDLFVMPEYRGRGIGKAMLTHCISLAYDRGCGRMEWTCLDWNTSAQRVYENLGARRMTEWYLYRLDRQALEDHVAKSASDTNTAGILETM